MKLITNHGHFLSYDPVRGVLCGDQGENAVLAVNVMFLDESRSAVFFVERSGSSREYIVFSNSGVLLSARPQNASNLRAIPQPDSFFYFSTEGLFLSVNPDGTVDFKMWMEVLERFFVVEPLSIIDTILKHTWYSSSLGIICQAILDADFVLRIGNLKHKITDIMRYGRARDKEVSLIYDGFCVERLSLYRPLIYFTAFGDGDIFLLLSICIRSIEIFGEYKGDYLIITDKQECEIHHLLPFVKPGRLIIENIPSFDVIDMVCARFKIERIKSMDCYQPIIYSDVDIVCNSSLTNMLSHLVKTEMVHVRSEGAIDLIHYGSTLMERDPTAKKKYDRGFNSGVIGFKNKAMVEFVLGAVERSIYCHLQNGLSRHATEAYDQPVANYVFNKLIDFDLTFFEQHVHPCLPSMDETMSSPGLVHFFGGVGATHKIDRVTRFFKRLMQDSGLEC